MKEEPSVLSPVTKPVRIYCKETGKLIATLDEKGLSVWCMYEKKPELISKEECLALWQTPTNV